jgi:ectoine hydroxylase-related dioxygenase (phytanoyl-CoA dioxygenase family)
VNPDQLSGFLTEEQAEQHCSDSEKAVDIVLEAGEVCLLHNWSLHSSDVNRSEQSRRAFSACYMDARTQNTDGRPTEYSVVLGEGALSVSDTGKVEAPAGLGAS